MNRLWTFFAIDALTGIKLQGYVEAETERQARERIHLAMKRIVVGTTDVGLSARIWSCFAWERPHEHD